jgi:urease accessory protein
MMFGSALRFEGAGGPVPVPDLPAIDLPASDLPASVRVDARLKLHVTFDDGATRLAERHERGAFRFRFPRAHGRAPEAVIVNIAGGLAGGDRLDSDIAVGEGATLALSSAAAERVYRSAGEMTRLATALAVDEGATCLWLPQETILHDGARLSRHFEIDLAARASLVFGEMLYFGRRASGEGFGAGDIRESWRIRRAGRLVLADETRLSGDFSADLRGQAALGDHVALATLVFAHPDASDHLDAIRQAIAPVSGVDIGATDLGGLVLLRLTGKDAAGLRRSFVALAGCLAGLARQPLPRAMMN